VKKETNSLWKKFKDFKRRFKEEVRISTCKRYSPTRYIKGFVKFLCSHPTIAINEYEISALVILPQE
jgi:hypothetical protein